MIILISLSLDNAAKIIGYTSREIHSEKLFDPNASLLLPYCWKDSYWALRIFRFYFFYSHVLTFMINRKMQRETNFVICCI